MKHLIAYVAIATLCGHYYIYTEGKIDRLTQIINLTIQKNEINEDELRETISVLQQKTIEEQSLQTRHYVAGAMDAIQRPDYYNKIWHEGYSQGQEVAKEMQEVAERETPKKTSLASQ